MTTAMGYRAPGWSVGDRLAALLAFRLDELRRLPAHTVAIHARRVGRVAAGATGVAFGLAMFLSSAHEGLRAGGVPTHLLMAAGPLMLLAYGLGRGLAPEALRRRLRAMLASGESAQHRLAQLEELGASAHAARRLTVVLEPWSLGLPMMAASLLVPLSLHLPIGLLGSPSTADFAGWIALSGAVVGHAHLFLAGASMRFAWRLRLRDPHPWDRPGWVVYGLTVAVSAVPGVVLLALPPAITAATGLIFVPAMFRWAFKVVERERALVGGGIE